MGNLHKVSFDRSKSNTILHITPGLRRGGAEMMLTRLVNALDGKQGFRHVILSLEPGNAFASEHQQAGVTVLFLGITSLASLPWNYFRFRRLVKDLNPALIHGWMYHGNMATYHAGAKCPMVFSIHNALDAWKHEKFTTRQIIRYGASMSRFANAVVYCSNISKTQHEAIGYNNTNAITIANGVDVDRFNPDNNARNQLRQAMNIPADHLLFGQVARYHPIKNQKGMLEAFALVAEKIPHAHLVLAGEGCDHRNPELSVIIDKLDCKNRIHLLGARKDVEKVLPAIDILVSPSLSEAFPVVITEAMACEVPCIATDVGDTAHIIQDAGMIVSKNDFLTGMVKAMIEMAGMPAAERRENGIKARLSIMKRFEIRNTMDAYETLYVTLTRQFDEN